MFRFSAVHIYLWSGISTRVTLPEGRDGQVSEALSIQTKSMEIDITNLHPYLPGRIHVSQSCRDKKDTFHYKIKLSKVKQVLKTS